MACTGPRRYTIDCSRLNCPRNAAMDNDHFRYYFHDCMSEWEVHRDAGQSTIAAAHDGSVVDSVDNRIRLVIVVKLVPDDTFE